ncbi:sigma-70 family RNA polymerase sigma factor [Novosphingobium sp.]|uniref:sigma-70 family RNA polymerase sigma factor n=1 Tax=Novosphingobium sp. TaxID=1874826 RepID=UPI00273468DE|nr:sigma-70 family RNA polymerase sigma factor [Novosphingobium sp.]MDP3908412.1 sigma-70 family RNA polymerase sigma factor [Novosphingobium sp.]
MKHDHRSFAAAGAYRPDATERVRRFVPMARRIAWHVHGGGRPGIELEDLMQAGMVALTEAAQRHSGPTEDEFAAYAKLRVRGAMVDLIRRHIPLSRGSTERRRHLRDQQTQLRGRLGRDPTAAELAEAMGLAEAELHALQSASEPVRFEPIDEIDSESDMAFADTRPDSLALLEDEELRTSVAAAIAALPERLQLVIQLYFVEELNLAEIAQALQVSVPRVHQLKAQALDRLRTELADVADVI